MNSKMGDSIEYCETCQSNVWCHLNRGCQRLDRLCPSDATHCSPSSETDNDTEAELAAWELLRDTRAELEKLRDAVRNMRDVKGRHHTQIATERLLALLPENDEL